MTDVLERLRAGQSADQQAFVRDIRDLIHEAKFRYRTVTELHQGLGFALHAASVQVYQSLLIAPEHRIDFVLTQADGQGGMRPYVGLVVRLGGSTPQVEKRLRTYAESGELSDLILVTRGAKHRRLGGLLLGDVSVTLARVS